MSLISLYAYNIQHNVPHSPVRIVKIDLQNNAPVPDETRGYIEQSYHHSELVPGLFAIGSPDSDADIVAGISARLPRSASISIHSVRGYESRPGEADNGMILEFHLRSPTKRNE